MPVKVKPGRKCLHEEAATGVVLKYTLMVFPRLKKY